MTTLTANELPGWARTLSHHGTLIKITSIRTLLPQRLPGAALVNNMPISVVHVNPLSWRERLLRWWQFIVIESIVWLTFQLVRGRILERYDEYADWWEWSESQIRKRLHRGLHVYTGKPRWATQPTQSWPTLATSGDARDVYDNALARHCTTQPFYMMIGPKPYADHS